VSVSTCALALLANSQQIAMAVQIAIPAFRMN
jgi:hypothetical protein